MPDMTLLGPILISLVAGPASARPHPDPAPPPVAACAGNHARGGAKALSLPEMVEELRRGCLALVDVRFRPGEDTIESISPSQFAQVARAIGLAQGAYRVSVPPEQSPGFWPDTLQARRRGIRLRDELVHYGASPSRLRDDLGWPFTAAVATGAAVPMLVRVPEQ
jgi:hypothetical protein